MEITVNTLSYIKCKRSTWSIFLFFSCSHSGLSPNKLVESSLFMSVPQTSIGKSFKEFWCAVSGLLCMLRKSVQLLRSSHAKLIPPLLRPLFSKVRRPWTNSPRSGLITTRSVQRNRSHCPGLDDSKLQ